MLAKDVQNRREFLFEKWLGLFKREVPFTIPMGIGHQMHRAFRFCRVISLILFVWTLEQLLKVL